jgi:hypothetical protein
MSLLLSAFQVAGRSLISLQLRSPKANHRYFSNRARLTRVGMSRRSLDLPSHVALNFTEYGIGTVSTESTAVLLRQK